MLWLPAAIVIIHPDPWQMTHWARVCCPLLAETDLALCLHWCAGSPISPGTQRLQQEAQAVLSAELSMQWAGSIAALILVGDGGLAPSLCTCACRCLGRL